MNEISLEQRSSAEVDYLKVIPENLYGHRRKLIFILECLSEWERATARAPLIMDLGCGTGSVVTRHLAELGYRIVGIDTNAPSIELARDTYSYSDLEFRCGDFRDEDRIFDVVMLIEVLEHIEDPATFLADVRAKLATDGCLLLTVPNGYGPFEIEKFLWRALRMDHVWTRRLAPLLKKLLRRNSGSSNESSPPLVVNSRDESSHVNFFTPSKMKALLASQGFVVRRIGKSSLIAGPFSSTFLPDSQRLYEINAVAGRIAPRWLVNGHYYLAAPASMSEA